MSDFAELERAARRGTEAPGAVAAGAGEDDLVARDKAGDRNAAGELIGFVAALLPVDGDPLTIRP